MTVFALAGVPQSGVFQGLLFRATLGHPARLISPICWGTANGGYATFAHTTTGV